MHSYGVPYTLTAPRGRGEQAARAVLLTVLFAVLTGVCAQLRVYLPFTPVPVTGQVFGVLLSGALLGGLGSVSQLLYVLLGLAGVPWFVLGPLGPTGGYIAGFVLAPLVIEAVVRRTGRLGPGLACGVGVIYLLGTVHFTLFTGTPLLEALRYTVLPFIPFDLGKAVAATAVSRLLAGGGWSRRGHRDGGRPQGGTGRPGA
ncbi:MAG: biotin transporter BioY [Spirochaetota bacterium]